ncbi:Uncharacterized protein CTYZ_00000072 [Cryptosporidium tyzzeri]|nr:Uncharacterized protein CTYZ_00000072 [Cryptosporidium tyzzeri]
MTGNDSKEALLEALEEAIAKNHQESREKKRKTPASIKNIPSSFGVSTKKNGMPDPAVRPKVPILPGTKIKRKKRSAVEDLTNDKEVYGKYLEYISLSGGTKNLQELFDSVNHSKSELIRLLEDGIGKSNLGLMPSDDPLAQKPPSYPPSKPQMPPPYQKPPSYPQPKPQIPPPYQKPPSYPQPKPQIPPPYQKPPSYPQPKPQIPPPYQKPPSYPPSKPQIPPPYQKPPSYPQPKPQIPPPYQKPPSYPQPKPQIPPPYQKPPSYPQPKPQISTSSGGQQVQLRFNSNGTLDTKNLDVSKISIKTIEKYSLSIKDGCKREVLELMKLLLKASEADLTNLKSLDKFVRGSRKCLVTNQKVSSISGGMCNNCFICKSSQVNQKNISNMEKVVAALVALVNYCTQNLRS